MWSKDRMVLVTLVPQVIPVPGVVARKLSRKEVSRCRTTGRTTEHAGSGLS